GLLALHFGGGTAAVGTSTGGVGALGTGTGGGSGLYALADDAGSYSLTADGTAQFLTDVVVVGTLYAPNVVNALPAADPGTAADGAAAARTDAGRRVANRAARTAARLRAARPT